jgi:O-antigen/teichoic acid export membrane protein
VNSPTSSRRQLLSGGVYAAMQAGSRVLGFLLLPVYTAVLPVGEYGRLGLLVTIQGAATMLMTGGLDSAFTRGFFELEEDPEAQTRLIASLWRFTIAVPLALALIAGGLLIGLATSGPVFRPSEAVLALLVAATTVGGSVVPQSLLRAENRLRDYVILTSVGALITPALMLLLVVGLKFGIWGWLSAALCGNVVFFAVAAARVPWRTSQKFDWLRVREALKIGAPLVPHALSLWALQLADRLVLAAIVSAAALGTYSLAGNLALPVMVVLAGVNQAFLPSYARSGARGGSIANLRGSANVQVAVTLGVCCGAALLMPVVVHVLPKGYIGASPLIPWLILGYAFLGLYFIPMNVISMAAKRTTFVWILSISSAGLNLLAVRFGVPLIGLSAAAEASALGYLGLLLFTLMFARHCRLELPISIRAVTVMAALSAAAYAVGTQSSEASLFGLLTRGGVTCALLGALAALVVPGARALNLWPNPFEGVRRPRGVDV